MSNFRVCTSSVCACMVGIPDLGRRLQEVLGLSMELWKVSWREPHNLQGLQDLDGLFGIAEKASCCKRALLSRTDLFIIADKPKTPGHKFRYQMAL